MKVYFSKEDKNNEIELEDMLFIGDYVEGEGVIYKLVGKAIIDNETYNHIVVEITLKEEPKNLCIKDILDTEWVFYDYIID